MRLIAELIAAILCALIPAIIERSRETLAESDPMIDERERLRRRIAKHWGLSR